MSIKWGADLSGIAPALLDADADVTCADGTWTTGILSQLAGTPVPLIQSTQQDFVPLIVGVLTIVLGATPPTALEIGYALVSGTELATFTVEPGLLVALAELMIPVVMAGPSALNAFGGAGNAPLIEVLATGADVTMTKIGSQAYFMTVLGND